jgi:hypothetical protein
MLVVTQKIGTALNLLEFYHYCYTAYILNLAIKIVVFNTNTIKPLQ